MSAYAIMDPSAVYCEEMGYSFSVVDTEEGETGMCNIDGELVDAWDFLRGKVKPENSYCRKQGHQIKTIQNSKKCSVVFSSECAVCVKRGVEAEVTTLMRLSFLEGKCGDGVCTNEESYLICPDDCGSGFADGYCDGADDDRCDPDCTGKEDVDCSIPGGAAECTDGDGECYCECINKDSDCEDENVSISSCRGEPTSGVYEKKIKCVYDGLCHEDCIGKRDIDCICKDLNSNECRDAIEKIGLNITNIISLLFFLFLLVF